MAAMPSMGIDVWELSSGSLLCHCPTPWPLTSWRLHASPTGRELFFASWWSYINTGPLVLDMADKQLYRVLDHPMDQLLWSPDGSRLAIGAAREIWITELDPNVPISQVLGRPVPGNDLIAYWLQKHTEAIAAAPSHPENYLERALAHMAGDQYDQAKSDLKQVIDLMTPEDHHVGLELFSWLQACCSGELLERAEILNPYAERLMEQFPQDVPSYQAVIESIIDWNQRQGNIERAERWRAKLGVPDDQAK